MSDVLTFDEASHTYTYGGVARPSTTQLLGKLHSFGMISEDVLAAACERGTIVHTLCEYHDQNDLDPASIGGYWPYLDAWINFCADYKVVWSHIEHRGYSKRYGFAGTLDRRGTLKGVRYSAVDIKTGKQSHPVWGLQTAAYRQLGAEEDPALWATGRRATVQLFDTGKYKFLPWDDPEDFPAFLALITLTNWSLK